MAKIPKEVQNLIARSSAEILKIQFEKDINRRFLLIKNRMIKEFLNHPVTKEIQGGAAAENISGTLGGNGNLFSYIGFPEGTDPIEPILNEFQKTSIRFAGISGETANWIIFMPTKDDIWDVSPVPWAPGRSWAKSMETGLSGVGQYLYDEIAEFKNSRSGTAIQTKQKLKRKSRFKNVKYISEILAKYEKLFSELDETAIST